ncbi:MAG TPA: AI-2E family transporter, partial [Polyangiaceae bacterium]|nr:AI-2E family transporter [Polyangiaceae bacterium]
LKLTAFPKPGISLVRFEPTAKGLLLTAVALGLAWLTLRLLPVGLVVVAALLLVGTLTPAVEWLERKGLGRGWGIGLAFSGLLLATVLLMALTVPSLVDQIGVLVKQEPALRGRIADVLARSGATAPLADSLRGARYDALAKSWSEAAYEYSTRFAEGVAYLVSAAFLALYVMIDRDRLRGGLFAVVPRTHHVRLSRILLNLEVIVGGYIRGQAVTSALMGGFTLVLLTVCGVHNALAIAAFAGLADVLPYVGVFLSVGPAFAASLARGPAIAAIVLIAMLAYEELESRVIVPRVYGRALRLPSSVVLVSLLAGGTLVGLAGALLALPAAAAVRMLIEELRVELPGEQIDDAVVRARDEEAEEAYERRAKGVPAVAAAAIAVEISAERREEELAIQKATESATNEAARIPDKT